MKQSALALAETIGLHVGIIMDGNGRWATARGLPRIAGHRAGAQAVRRTVKAAPGLGIATLTVFAFSSDNWRRPRQEVEALMGLFRTYLRRETRSCVENGVRVQMIGRRDRLPAAVVRAVEEAERATAGGLTLHLRLAVDYSGRDAILAAARRLPAGAEPSRAAFARALAGSVPDCGPARDVDLLVRTGGEQRLSDFLLWESAYAEFWFTPRMWPDFCATDLEAAVQAFRARDRRFGRAPDAAAG